MSREIINCFTLARELGVKPVEVQHFAEKVGVHRVHLAARITAAEAAKVREYARSRASRAAQRNQYFAQERADRRRAERAGARLVTSSSPERDAFGKVVWETFQAGLSPSDGPDD